MPQQSLQSLINYDQRQGQTFPAILPEHEEFIRKQRIFFVGSAPLNEEGHINISPKGYDVTHFNSGPLRRVNKVL